MIYIFLKDSTLMAFEGPEEPVQKEEGSFIHFTWKEAMSTARESALPLVDDEPLKGTGIEITREPVALPGWGLEKQFQVKDKNVVGGWLPISETIWKMHNLYNKREAYRLKRSEHDKPTIPVPLFTAAPGFMTPNKQFYAHYKDGKFVIPKIEDHKPVGEKPENSAHGYTKLYEESGIITESQFIELNRVEPSESQEEIKQLREWNEAHKETNKRLHDLMVDAEKRGERKGWNDALEAIEKLSVEASWFHSMPLQSKFLEELKKLKR